MGLTFAVGSGRLRVNRICLFFGNISGLDYVEQFFYRYRLGGCGFLHPRLPFVKPQNTKGRVKVISAAQYFRRPLPGCYGAQLSRFPKRCGKRVMDVYRYLRAGPRVTIQVIEVILNNRTPFVCSSLAFRCNTERCFLTRGKNKRRLQAQK